MHRLLLLTLLLVAACNDRHTPQHQYPTAPVASGPGWYPLYSIGVPSPLPKDAAGNYYFDFPRYDGAPKNGAGVHYVVKQPPALVGKTIVMTFVLEGTGTLYPTDPQDTSPVAIMRLFIQRKGDDLTKEHYRYWSNPIVVKLAGPGTYTVTVKIVPDQWSSVFGKMGTDNVTAFNDAVANASNMGFTFGGIFAGHGNAVSGGPMRFILKEYRVQ